MRLLVLGGTGFLGGAVVADALRRGWTVTVLNRGERGPAPAGVTALRGDRSAPDGLAELAGAGEWDLVVDTWSGAARAVLASATALADRAGRYAYVSSRSVYANPVDLGADETAPIVEARSDGGDDGYAEMKAGGERAALEVFGPRATIARAGLILGPGEDIGRLPWWLRRVQRGGDVLAPGPADLPLQYIDARDLAAWLLDSPGGIFNTVSRTGHTTMGELLAAVLATVGATVGSSTGSPARLVWTDPDVILAAGVEPWNDLPIWIPAGHEYRWLHESDVRHAYETGLTPRPITETVADTWEWLLRVGDLPVKAGRPPLGLDPAREAELLVVSSGRLDG